MSSDIKIIESPNGLPAATVSFTMWQLDALVCALKSHGHELTCTLEDDPSLSHDEWFQDHYHSTLRECARLEAVLDMLMPLTKEVVEEAIARKEGEQ